MTGPEDLGVKEVVYRYSQTDEATFQGKLRDTTSSFTARIRPRVGDLQEVEYSEGDAPITETWRWTPTAKSIVSYHSRLDGTCLWSPPVLALRLPLRTGERWKSSSRCTTDGSPGVQVVYEQETAVLGQGTRTVGGYGTTTFWSLRIKAVYSIESVPRGRIDIDEEVEYAPSLLMPLNDARESRTISEDLRHAQTERRTRSLLPKDY
jgi:hypothetical protein